VKVEAAGEVRAARPLPVRVLEGEEARAEAREKTVEYTLVRRGGRWKIASPQLEPHVSTDVALGLIEGLANNRFVAADPEKIRLSREAVQKMAAGRVAQ
jgi:hypothetical protein